MGRSIIGRYNTSKPGEPQAKPPRGRRRNRAPSAEDRRIKSLPRIVFRLAAGAAALVFVVFAALVLWLRYFGLPNVDRYREEIVSSIEKASGMVLSVRSIHGGWGGLRPTLSLEGLAISDRGGKPVFALQRAEVTLSWWSLLRGRVRFHDVDFYRPVLELRRAPDGLVYLADKPLNMAGPDQEGAFTEWLLAQPRLGIHDATLVWRDEFAGALGVRLTGVEITVERHFGRHRAALSAVPPRELAARIDVRTDVRLVRRGREWRAAGDLYAETLNADLGRLRAHLPVPDTLRSGVGSLRVWAKFSFERVDEVVADLAMRDARAQLAEDAPPLELAAISGRATYRSLPQGFTFATDGLRFRLASGLEARPGNFSLTRITEASRSQVEVHADGIDLTIAATLLDYFPVPRDMKGQVLRFAPRGRIADAAFTWSGDSASPARRYALKGRFEDVAVNAVDGFPGATGLSGSIEGTEQGGTLRLAARRGSFDLPGVFRAPLALDTLDARARWKKEGHALEVKVEDAHFANPDAEGNVAGSWRSSPKSPGIVDIRGRLVRAEANRVAPYLPNRAASVRTWLEKSVLAGHSSHVDFELKGDLAEFPFGKGSAGHFLVAGDLHGGRLKYHPDWPSVDAIEGGFRFENRGMKIRAERAAIFASRVKSATAVIADLAAQPPVLTIDGEVDTTGADSVRFLRESPLASGPGAITKVVALEGPGSLRLHFDYPLWGPNAVRVAGDYDFAGETATVARKLAFQNVKGRLSFTERGVSAPSLTGTVFGKPAVLSMATQPDGQVATTVDGRVDAAKLAGYLPASIASRLSGETDWKVRVLTGRQGTDVDVASGLRGLEVRLPVPLAKAAAASRAIAVHISRLGADDQVATLALEGGVYGRFAHRDVGGSDLWQAALKFGAPVSAEPVRDGLWLYGRLATFDVDAWQAVFGTPHGEAEVAKAREERARGLELRGLDLALGEVRYMGREFKDMHARLERSGSSWSGRLASPLITGNVDWNPEGKGRMTAKLEHLAIPESASHGDAAETSRPAEDLPALDVAAERFDFRGHTLGRLELQAQNAGDEWRIDRLDITSGHAQFKGRGGWRRTGAGAITTLAIEVDAGNLNALFAQFGYGDYLKRGTGHLKGTVAWPGYPYDFAIAALSGTFKVDARGGQFAKIEPGAGKLLGLLSLQSLPRRAMLDFRDVFSEGFAFERIHGNVKLARGILATEDFEISGPSAFVSLAGEVSLPQETQTITLRVVPEVSEGLALAATVLGTPVLGLSTLLVSKLLRNPFGKVVAYEYQVTGSWDNPNVTRTSGAPVRAADSASPSAGKAGTAAP